MYITRATPVNPKDSRCIVVSFAASVPAFPQPLSRGSRLVFEDMACYTMVKNTMFNGVSLPAIAIQDANTGRVRVVRSFDYQDYRQRLS